MSRSKYYYLAAVKASTGNSNNGSILYICHIQLVVFFISEKSLLQQVNWIEKNLYQFKANWIHSESKLLKRWKCPKLKNSRTHKWRSTTKKQTVGWLSTTRFTMSRNSKKRLVFISSIQSEELCELIFL